MSPTPGNFEEVWAEPILHVDMDAFYVEVERLFDPTLRSLPVAVGGIGPRGTIASASYEAREEGVHSAQPTALARRVCPRLRVIPPYHPRYAEISARVFSVFREFSPLVEGLSLDEAFVDISGLRLHYHSPVAVAEAIKERIRSEVGIPSSVGIGPNKLVAKLASGAAKPDGIKHVPVEDKIVFLHALPVGALPGVGPATHASLTRLGIETVADLSLTPAPTLGRILGPNMGRQLLELARGVDTRAVIPDQEVKSISVEETYPVDLEGVAVVTGALFDHARGLSERLRRAGVAARTVSLKVRFPDFETITRSRTSSRPIQSAGELFDVSRSLLAEVSLEGPVRLIGLAATTLERDDQPRQAELAFPDDG